MKNFPYSPVDLPKLADVAERVWRESDTDLWSFYHRVCLVRCIADKEGR